MGKEREAGIRGDVFKVCQRIHSRDPIVTLSSRPELLDWVILSTLSACLPCQALAFLTLIGRCTCHLQFDFYPDSSLLGDFWESIPGTETPTIL